MFLLKVCVCLCAFVFARGASPPNVVFIFADDLGFGDPGFAGHPTNLTPQIDALRARGKRFSSWYSGCPVCTGSRASLMTGRVYSRIGMPGVFPPASKAGLPLNEVLLPEQFKTAGYSTAMFGKWHLGQRAPYLPAARGFDSYLGIPYSDDMGQGRLSGCDEEQGASREKVNVASSNPAHSNDNEAFRVSLREMWGDYVDSGFAEKKDLEHSLGDLGGLYLPLVEQRTKGEVRTRVLEQPVDLTHLATKYADFAKNYIAEATSPFFLYAALSHVHTTAPNLPDRQYAGCAFRGGNPARGAFGDAIAEADWVVGEVVAAVEEAGLHRSTLYVFSSDNGPWLIQRESAGSMGHVYGGYAGYWNTGKGSTWEGGIREPAFAVWEGVIEPGSTTLAAISSVDVFPTLSKLIGVPLPSELVYNGSKIPAMFDGVDQSEAFFGQGTTPTRECIFFFGGPYGAQRPSAARCGPHKLHFATGPGIGGDKNDIQYHDPPLVFNVEADPSEIWPLDDLKAKAPRSIALVALTKYMATYSPGVLTRDNGGVVDDLDDEIVNGTVLYAVCCDRSRANTCDCDGPPYYPQ